MDIEPIVLTFATICFFVVMAIVVLHLDPEWKIILVKEKLMTKKIAITILWFINLSIFMVLLWGGEYLISRGYVWVKNPVEVSLISCGVTKAVLSGLLFLSWMSDRNE